MSNKSKHFFLLYCSSHSQGLLLTTSARFGFLKHDLELKSMETKSIDTPIVALCTFQSLILLVLMPFCNICAFLWCYTALPLHFLDAKWPIFQLSLLFFFIYLPRVFVQLLTRRVGDWICVPISLLAVVSNIILFLYPNSLTAVWISLSCTCSALNPTSYRGMLHSRFAASGDWQMKRALRIYTFSDTLGYACAPFIGGILYDNGQLRACALFAIILTSIGTLAPLILKGWWKSFATVKTCGKRVVNVHEQKSIESKSKETQTKTETEIETAIFPTIPVAVVMLAVYTNICTYAVEWCLYAIYFRLQYGWSGAWCGFAQMIGDLLGAGCLTLSTMACISNMTAKNGCCKHNKLPSFFRAIIKPPFSICFLSLCHGALMVMLAQSNFVVALCGQIIMGTVYVFYEQSLQEMLLIYSFGNGKLYRKLLSIHYLVFTAGCALCSPISYGLYALDGFALAFYATGTFVSVVGIGIAVYFAVRLNSTNSGVFGDFAEAEKELQELQRTRRNGKNILW